jgi:hypothetical protein
MTRSSGRLERDQLDLSADCVRNHPVLHHPGRRQEREFCDWRRAAENDPFSRTETQIQRRPTRKPRQQRAFLISLQKYVKQQTGWWRRKGSNWLPPTQSLEPVSENAIHGLKFSL